MAAAGNLSSGEGLWFWIVIITGEYVREITAESVEKLHINPKNLLWITFQRLRTFLFSASA